MIELNKKIQLLLFLMLRRLILILVHVFNRLSSLVIISRIRSIRNRNSNKTNINKTKRKNRMEMTVGLVSKVALQIKNKKKISKNNYKITIKINRNNNKKKMMLKKKSEHHHPPHQIKNSQLTIRCRFTLTKDIFEKWELTLART